VLLENVALKMLRKGVGVETENGKSLLKKVAEIGIRKRIPKRNWNEPENVCGYVTC